MDERSSANNVPVVPGKLLEHVVGESRLMADMMKNHERENTRLWFVLLVTLALFVGYMIFDMYQDRKQDERINTAVTEAIQGSQDMFNTALLEALNTVAEVEHTVTETTTTNTQTAEGDYATINNVEGEQYNDNAIKTGGAD